jgi:CRP-like cAMP-binding protein
MLQPSWLRVCVTVDIMDLATFEKYERQNLAADTIIFRENDPGDAMYVILSGRVAIVKRVMDKVEKTLAILEAGEYFGEMSLLLKADRTATAKTVDDSVVVKLTRETFKRLLQEHFEIGVNLLIQLAHRLEKSNEEAILAALELELSKRKPAAYLPAVEPAVHVIIASGSFAAQDMETVFRLRKTLQWAQETNVLLSLVRPGQVQDGLIYIFQTDDARELLKLTTNLQGLVEWNISLAVAADENFGEVMMKYEQ